MRKAKWQNYQVRRLPVCDQDNHVIGILTLGDFSKNDEQLGKTTSLYNNR